LPAPRFPPSYPSGCDRLSPGTTPVPDGPSFPSRVPGRCGPIHKFRGCGPALARSASYPCPFRQDRASWPPSLLRQVPNVTSVSPGFLGFPRSYAVPTKRSLTFRLPASRRARLQHPAPAAPRRAEVSTLPLFIRLEQCLLAASIPAPGFPAYESHPQARPDFPRDCGSRLAVFLLTAPGLTWAILWSSRSLSSAACSGQQATPVRYGRTEPPGRRPSCARLSAFPVSQAGRFRSFQAYGATAFPSRFPGPGGASPWLVTQPGL